MRDNVCIFQKVVHTKSGEPLENAYLIQGTYIETMELDGPKLILDYRDTEDRISNKLQIKEYDEIAVTMGDPWHDNSAMISETFVVLACKPAAGSSGAVRLSLMAKPTFDLKQMADKTRVFNNNGLASIAQAFAKGMKLDVSKFPVIGSYHCIAGERPSIMLRQMAEEHGAHIWMCRGKMQLKRFAELFVQAPAATLHYGVQNTPDLILSYTKPSGQLKAQESAARSFSGWDELKGRVKTSPALKLLSGVSSKPPAMAASPSPYVLSNAPIVKKPAIDFTAFGKMLVTPGQVLKLVWHMPDPAEPVNEGLPDKVIVESVAHWYSDQKYYMRVKGAVAYVPY